MTVNASDVTVHPAVLVKPGGSGKSRSLADRMETSPRLYLFLFTLVYAVGITANNARRGLWMDELFTYYLADLPSISDIWPMIGRGIELNPPLPFWLTWVVHHAIGKGEILSRLPSTAGFWVMSICLFHFVRRRSDAVHGFIALLLPVFTFAATEGTFARGYGLLLGFSGIALLCWQFAIDGMRRPLALAGLAAGIAGAISSHYYGVYVAAALGLAELVRIRRRHRLDLPIFAALAIGLSPLVAYIPLITSARKGFATYLIEPLADSLYQSYADLLGAVSIVLFLLFLQLISRSESPLPQWMPTSLKPEESAACAMLVLMPLVLYVAAVLGKAAFYPRYVQPVVLGFSVVVALFAFRIGGGGDSFFRRTAVEVLVWLCLTPWCCWQVAKVVFLAPPGAYYLNKADLTIAPDLPLVIDSDADFMSMYYYAPPSVRARLFTLDDAALSVRYRGTDTGLHSLEVGQTFRDLHLVDYHKFIAEHAEFLIARTRPTSWMIQALLADGARVELVDYRKGAGTAVEETLMFRVKINGGSVQVLK